MLIQRNASKAEDLLPIDQNVSSPTTTRYVRDNTFKMQVNKVLEELQKSIEGKASCMPAQALAPYPDSEVIDACAAPGNKTVQLAALMKGRKKIFACEVNKKRLRWLQETVELAGASNVEVCHEDFLKIDPRCASFSKVQAILLDPSCSGSGTTRQRLDHLLPLSATCQNTDAIEMQKIESLARFQEKSLRHALPFPSVERVIYSTCSLHQQETEKVVQAVLPYASSLHFYLETPFPTWPQRGLPVFDKAHHLLRTEPSGNLEGFFIALFVRRKYSLRTADLNEAQTEKHKFHVRRRGGKDNGQYIRTENEDT